MAEKFPPLYHMKESAKGFVHHIHIFYGQNKRRGIAAPFVQLLYIHNKGRLPRTRHISEIKAR